MTRRLLLLNGLAVLMVPLHHSTSFGLQAMFQWADRYLPVSRPNYDQLGSLPYYILMFIRQLDSFGVPAFLVVSGFFIAFMGKGEGQQVTWKMVWPRIRVLLAPFILWTILRYILLMRAPDSIDDVLDPYYYVVLMVQFFLLAPVLVPWARKNWWSLLCVAALLQLTIEAAELFNALGVESVVLQAFRRFSFRWIFPARIFDFSLGVVIGTHLEGAKLWLAKAKWALLAGVVVTLAVALFEYQFLSSLSDRVWLGANNPGLSRILYASLVGPCFLAFADVKWPQRLADLGVNSFGVYMANIPFQFSAASIMYHAFPWALGVQLVYQSVLISVGIAGPLLLMRLWRASPARPYYRLLFG